MSNVIAFKKRRPSWTPAERLRKARREIGLNQEKMAEKLGTKLGTYSAWETGRNTPDMLALSPKLEEITGIDRLWFIGWAEGTDPQGPNGDGGVTGLYRHSPGNVQPIRPIIELKAAA